MKSCEFLLPWPKNEKFTLWIIFSTIPHNEDVEEERKKMSQQSTPDLKQYMDKKLSIKLNGKRSVTGVLRGFDQFMNLVLDAAIEETGSQSNKIGTIVRFLFSLLLFSL